jgi:hypothetical protein
MLKSVYLQNHFLHGLQTTIGDEIWGSHGGEYEDGCLLGCSAM